MKVLVGARSSALSRAQVKEVEEELQQFHPHLFFEPIFIHTTGDLDRKTSLRTLGKTDFFTREIDEMLLSGTCRIAIHSAKDLPEPLMEGLMQVALTKGKDPRDALVMRDGEKIADVKRVATSSVQREERVKQIKSDIAFYDVRGTIEERLQLLERGVVDGVVIAECALIRLGLKRNRVFLPGESTLHQGQLSVLARVEDKEMEEVFKPLDTFSQSSLQMQSS